MAETKINANQTNITASDIGGLTNNTSNSESLSINGTISGTGSYNTAIQGSITSSNAEKSVAIGYNANVYSHYSIALGAQAYANYYAIAIGRSSQADGTNAIAIGVEAEATAANAIQLGAGSREVRRNIDANTFKVGNANGNYELMSADGTIPEARLADTTNAQQGDVLTLDANGDAVWQAGSGGGLPSQTGNAGKFLTTDGTDASWATINALQNTATGTDSLTILGTASSLQDSINIGVGSTSGRDCVIIGHNAKRGDYSGSYGVAIGSNTKISTNAGYEVAVGNYARCAASHAIQLGSTGSATTNSDSNTFKVANANGNFEIMSADGTVPTARLTKVNSTITLTAADWSSNTQTVNVTGMTATGVVFVSPDPTDQADYTSAGILCTAQAAGTLTFTCDTVPSGDIDVNVVML